MTSLVDKLSVVEIAGFGDEKILQGDLATNVLDLPVAESTCVAVSFQNPLLLIRALVALDGQVGSMLLLSGEFAQDTVKKLVEKAGCSALLTDRNDLGALKGVHSFADAIAEGSQEPVRTTKWLMTTSGTTGIPKIVPHTLKSLARSVYRFAPLDVPSWGLLYDPTRFAGLQVTLQALIGGGRLLVVDTRRTLGEQIAELGAKGCTHLSATPTLWRRILMAPEHKKLDLKQVTLGGEIADQATIDALRASFPKARVTHIYASTEAGVGFSVNDGRCGFPEEYLRVAPGGTKLKVVDGILWLRPPMFAASAGPEVEVDADGYVRSGDMVTNVDGRLQFLGRENGLINVGGVKFYPETVETAVKGVQGVALVRITTKKSPITGTLVVAEVQLADKAEPTAVKQDIIETCRAKLDREAVPAIVRFVDSFETNAAGKLDRKRGDEK